MAESVKEKWKRVTSELSEEMELSRQEKAALTATVAHETGGFKRVDENMNYSAKRLKHMKNLYLKGQGGFSALKDYTDEEIDDLASKGEKAIADVVYGNRKGMGNRGEGYKFRGRGLLQVTGRKNYKDLSRSLFPDDSDRFVNNPELLNTDEETMKRAMEHFWKKNVRPKAGDFSDMDKVTKGINPYEGKKIRAKRTKLFDKYNTQFGEEDQNIWNKDAMDQIKEQSEEQGKRDQIMNLFRKRNRNQSWQN